MSRSHRKPYFACGLGGSARKFYKRYSNKLIRRFKADISDGRQFIAHGTDRRNICDVKFYCGKSPKDRRLMRK